FGSFVGLGSDYVNAEGSSESETAPSVRELPVPRTESPRRTMTSFLQLKDRFVLTVQSYLETRSRSDLESISLMNQHLRSFLDLSSVQATHRVQVGNETILAILDIIGRKGRPNLDTVPDADAIEGKDNAFYRIPGTPLRIVRMDDGDRAGEFLFEARTVAVAPRFLRGIYNLPLQSPLDIESYTRFQPQLTGPWIPVDFVRGLPEWLKKTWFDTPIWKTGFLAIIAVGFVWLMLKLHHVLSQHRPESGMKLLAWRLIMPIAISAFVWIVYPFVIGQLFLAGDVLRLANKASVALTYIAVAWIFWLVCKIFFEGLIHSPNIKTESLDSNLLRLVRNVTGLLGTTMILAVGGQELGLPVLSLVAGLGIGGLAVALAIRPTLENLVGGVILYIDKPVRVGDFCSFGTDIGTVERIGVRSTEIRALDRTLVTVPNAQFADMKLVNWAHCDRLLINQTIGLRFETTTDQMRLVLAKIREMLHAHPRIDRNTVRVRYAGPADSSRDVNIRIHALTRDWNDFHAIREDVFLRIDDIIDQSGTGYAFPSQTLYLNRDKGLDPTLQKEAEEQTKRWRRTGKLPFPRLSEDRINELEGTLDYPPKGSVEAGGEIELDPETSEPLFSEPLAGEAHGTEHPVEAQDKK
ncbi:MAG: mechanosensitive ion channel family protein, partial [Anderseniella sp.]